ncbi:hypothetical protein QYE76_026295 [Lolium multiflorum]|uniref:F-box protein AT5G49610-like beta-propeller domain-containing protein n=1 Tax=Lolium multiflorum TaxID=4521 RepID=A0AAD8VXU4_LOLMU|nr:hypothetical protein QYE76_026295 [Lolium multiflorum]
MEDDAAAAAAAVSKVLADDDLLAEILLRVGFPTTLVRAAAVCKRWLHHASHKAFLRRFRKLNPPRILGFYTQVFQGDPRFVPMLPQPPELAAAVQIVKGYSFGTPNDGHSLVRHQVLVQDCRNGSVSTALRSTRDHAMVEEWLGFSVGMHSPLCPEKAMAIDPPLSPHHHRGPGCFLILSREEKDGGLSYFFVLLENPMNWDITSATNFTAHVFMLKDGAWCMLASATTQIVHWRGDIRAVLVDNRIYIMATYIEITVLDLTTSSFSTVKLPQGVGCSMLSQADDASSVYLIGVKEHQLGIWLHKGGSLSIVDTICLREMCANLMMSDCRVKDVLTFPLWIVHVGDNAEFVILQMGRFVFYLDTRCRTLRTLYENPEDGPYQVDFSSRPFMMIWPPTFPALKCDPTRFAVWPLNTLYYSDLIDVL